MSKIYRNRENHEICDCVVYSETAEQLLLVETEVVVGVIVVLLFYVHGKHLRSCRDGQLT